MLMKTATPEPATLAQLHHLLDAGDALSATFRNQLSNHLPMAQQALLELGASAQRLQDWTEHYETFLEPRRGCERQALVEIARDLGQPKADAAWRAHFAACIEGSGSGPALREALALLLPGAGAMAFHGLIRTGHAVLAGHEAELAAGLAHWAAHFMSLPTTDDGPLLDLPDWLHALQQLPRPPVAGSLITGRMQAWGESPGFVAVAGRLRHGPDTLRDLALLAARTYAATGNFTVLHLLTASHAMSVLQPWWPTPGELPRGFSIAAAAGLLASGATPVLALEHPPSRPWPALIAAACAQDDAHVIKLTHAAWRLGRRWPDPAWRAAVERAIPF